MARRPLTYQARLNPRWPRTGNWYYFRRYAVSLTRGSARGGFTSHGFHMRFGRLGPVTINLTTRTWTWDSPGRGSVSRSWGDPRPRPRRQPAGSGR